MQTQEIPIQTEDDRTGLSVDTLKRAILDNLFYIQGKFPEIATPHDYYMALAYTIRDRLLQRWITTTETYGATQTRVVGYLSAEFLLGLTAQEVSRLRQNHYNPCYYYHNNPWYYYHSNPELRGVIDRLTSGYFSPDDPSLFRPLIETLLSQDTYLLLADYQFYIDCQEKVSQAYRDLTHWTRMSILNVARMGKFSADRAIREYCQDIWQISPIPVGLAPLV
jgi:glucan phosphorylase